MTPDPALDNAALERILQHQQRTESLLECINQAIDRLPQHRGALLTEWHRVAIELAVAVSAKLMRRQIEAGDFPFDSMIREMVNSFSATVPLSVYLHPDDLKLVNRQAFADRSVQWQTDAALNRGDCRVDDGERVLLSELIQQLSAIREAMLRSLSHAT